MQKAATGLAGRRQMSVKATAATRPTSANDLILLVARKGAIEVAA